MERQFIVTAAHERVKAETARRLRREMTPSERRLWQRLRANRLGGLHFRRQQIIVGFIVDFYCHAARLAVEVDGPIHDDQMWYDAERDRILQAQDLRLIRFTNERVDRELNAVLSTIHTTARQAY